MLSLDYTVLFQLAIFLFVMAGLNAFVFKPVARHRAKRSGVTDGLEERLLVLRKDLDEKAGRYVRQLDESRNEVLEIKAGLKKEIDRERDALLAGARAEAEEITRRETASLGEQVVAVRQHLDSQTRELAEAMFTKIMGRAPGGGHSR